MVGFRREQYLGKELRYIRSNGFTRTEVASLRGGARCVESKNKKKKKTYQNFLDSAPSSSKAFIVYTLQSAECIIRNNNRGRAVEWPIKRRERPITRWAYDSLGDARCRRYSILSLSLSLTLASSYFVTVPLYYKTRTLFSRYFFSTDSATSFNVHASTSGSSHGFYTRAYRCKLTIAIWKCVTLAEQTF